ncbi:MAG: acyl-CoA reductase [Rikenellaceae bacterium]
MKRTIEIFEKLGKALQKGAPTAILREATEQNKWFSEQEINLAIEAIYKTMLAPEKVEEWMKNYSLRTTQKSEKVLIVMAGNIPLVGFFDLLCTIASGHKAIIKPSHKDRALMLWVISLLKEIEPTIPIYIIEERASSDAIDPDIVIATGSDSTAIHFKNRYKGKKMLLRGSRHSIAILSGKESTEELKALSRDIYDYSGQGCRNISMIFVPRGYDLHKIAPPAEGEEATNQKYRNNYRQNRALLTMNGTTFHDNGASCLIKSDEFPLRLSSISIVEYDNTSEVEEWAKAHDNEIQCIATNIAQISSKFARAVKLGEAQHPTLFDYADGVDTMQFLLQD